MRVVGLTGGVATGKSTVAAAWRAIGAPVIDADAVAREVVAPGTDGLAAIALAFGPSALTAAGELDRAAMRARIAADPAAKRQLEAITHPRIYARMAEQLGALAAAGAPAAAVEAALMVETGSYRQYPVLVVATCSPEVQLARLMARDGQTEAQARALIATQLPLAEKERVATHVIRTDVPRDTLDATARALWRQLVGSAA